MVYIFDPTTCEEPKKPTYRYSPIPKTVKYCCCPNPTDYEEGDNTTELGSTNPPVPVIPGNVNDNNSGGNTDKPNEAPVEECKTVIKYELVADAEGNTTVVEIQDEECGTGRNR